MKKIILSVVATTSLVFGSATIFNGDSETVEFTSKPSGATVKVNGFPTCETPCKAELKRGADGVNITIEKKGYEKSYLQAPTHWGVGWFVLDIVWDLGTTDALTGAWYEYDKNKYFIELKKKSN